MAQIIVINSVNRLTGKTMLAAHLAVMLAADYQTAVLDSAPAESPLAFFIAKRYNLNLNKNYNLPVPPYYSLQKEKFEELNKTCDVLILDSPEEKYLQYADILITPFLGAEGLNAVSAADSLYAAFIWEAKKKRAALGKNAFRWIVCPNDNFIPEDINKLVSAGKILGFQLAPRLQQRAEYAEGLKNGVTVLDKDQPALKTLFDLPDLYARRELKRFAAFIWPEK